MDESWRMRIGLNLPRRRSTEETSTHRILSFGFNSSDSDTTLDPQDFSDVFGGPPQTVLSRKNSATTDNLYQDVFRSSESVLPTRKGRNLPVFRIPVMQSETGRRKGVSQRNEQGFYDDIFGSDEDRRSRSRSKVNIKSKSNSSSVLSSEDLSPLRPSFAEDVFFPSFSSTSKLRPLNIPLQRSPSSRVFQSQQNLQVKSDTPPWLRPPLAESNFLGNNLSKNCKSSPSKLFQSGSSLETITIEPNSYHSIRASIEDIEIETPSSVVSSLCNRDPESISAFQDKALQKEDDDDDEEEEIMSSYVIELSSEKRKGVKDESVVAIDEAIAWAKEKFQRQNLEAIGGGCIQRQNASPSTKELFTEKQGRLPRHEHWNQQLDVHGRAQFLMVNEKLRSWITQEKQQSEKDAGWL